MFLNLRFWLKELNCEYTFCHFTCEYIQIDFSCHNLGKSQLFVFKKNPKSYDFFFFSEFSVTKHQSYINVDGPPLASIDRLDKSKEILLCLSPQRERIDSTYQIMENVLLHLYFGVNFFHIYDNGLTNKFIQTLSQPHQKLSHLNIQILPWNVPDKISDQLMQHIGINVFQFFMGFFKYYGKCLIISKGFPFGRRRKKEGKSRS